MGKDSDHYRDLREEARGWLVDERNAPPHAAALATKGHKDHKKRILLLCSLCSIVASKGVR